MCIGCVCICAYTAEHPTCNPEVPLGGHDFVFPPCLPWSGANSGPFYWTVGAAAQGRPSTCCSLWPQRLSSISSPGRCACACACMCVCVCVCVYKRSRPLSSHQVRLEGHRSEGTGGQTPPDALTQLCLMGALARSHLERRGRRRFLRGNLNEAPPPP